MHTDDEHFLVVGPVEDADTPTFRQITCGPPEEIMFQLGGAWMFKLNT